MTETHVTERTTPSTGTDKTYTSQPPKILLRGLRLRCPRCGQGGLFKRWTEMAEACPGCGLVFEQEEGYWAGALTYNTMITLILFSIYIGASAALTWPTMPLLPLVGGGVVVAMLFPIFFYPFSKTIWVATDLVFFSSWRMQPGTGLRKAR